MDHQYATAIAFTPVVKAMAERYGSRKSYTRDVIVPSTSYPATRKKRTLEIVRLASNSREQ